MSNDPRFVAHFIFKGLIVSAELRCGGEEFQKYLHGIYAQLRNRLGGLHPENSAKTSGTLWVRCNLVFPVFSAVDTTRSESLIGGVLTHQVITALMTFEFGSHSGVYSIITTGPVHGRDYLFYLKPNDGPHSQNMPLCVVSGSNHDLFPMLWYSQEPSHRTFDLIMSFLDRDFSSLPRLAFSKLIRQRATQELVDFLASKGLFQVRGDPRWVCSGKMLYFHTRQVTNPPCEASPTRSFFLLLVGRVFDLYNIDDSTENESTLEDWQ